MVLYQIDIQKAVSAFYWTNRYFVDATSFPDAIVEGEKLAQIEKNVHVTYVDFVSVRASKPGKEKPSQFLTATLGFQGVRGADGIVPLTTCVRPELYRGFSRPDVRYLRGVVREGDQANIRSFSDLFITYITDNYVNPVIALPSSRSHAGLVYVSGRCNPNVANHQMRRGSKKKTTPVIPVGP